jgi:hypothetical protein
MAQASGTEAAIALGNNNPLVVASIYFSAIVITILGLLICLAALGSLLPLRFASLGNAFMFAAMGLSTI